MKFPPKTLLVVLALACAFFTSRAQARLVIGDIDFSGVVTFDTMSLATAKQVSNWNTSFVSRDTGDFSGISFGTHSVMSAWAFNPSTPTPSLWTVGGFTFDLSNSVVASQSATFLNVSGVGSISGNGFDPTPGLWSFTSSNSNGNNSSTFSFQSNTVAVPENGSLALFTLGLSLIVLLQARRKAIKLS